MMWTGTRRGSLWLRCPWMVETSVHSWKHEAAGIVGIGRAGNFSRLSTMRHTGDDSITSLAYIGGFTVRHPWHFPWNRPATGTCLAWMAVTSSLQPSIPVLQMTALTSTVKSPALLSQTVT